MEIKTTLIFLRHTNFDAIKSSYKCFHTTKKKPIGKFKEMIIKAL